MSRGSDPDSEQKVGTIEGGNVYEIQMIPNYTIDIPKKEKFTENEFFFTRNYNKKYS